jgi:hypothetical protein
MVAPVAQPGSPETDRRSDNKTIVPAPLTTGDWTDIVTAVVIAAAIYAGLLWFAMHYSDASRSPILILAGLLGASLGWVVGLLVSPYNEGEQSAFGEYGKLIYGFLSGYLLSKFDPVIARALTEGVDSSWVVIGCFGLTSFLVAVPVTYITRRYWRRASTAP